MLFVMWPIDYNCCSIFFHMIYKHVLWWNFISILDFILEISVKFLFFWESKFSLFLQYTITETKISVFPWLFVLNFAANFAMESERLGLRKYCKFHINPEFQDVYTWYKPQNMLLNELRLFR